MNKLAGLLIFTAGVIVGAVATYKIVKETYEQIATDEIESMRE